MNWINRLIVKNWLKNHLFKFIWVTLWVNWQIFHSSFHCPLFSLCKIKLFVFSFDFRVKYKFLGSLVKILPSLCVSLPFLRIISSLCLWRHCTCQLWNSEASNSQLTSEKLRETELSRHFHKMEKRNDTKLKISSDTKVILSKLNLYIKAPWT